MKIRGTGICTGDCFFMLSRLEVMGHPLKGSDQPLEWKGPPRMYRAEEEKEFVDVQGHVVIGEELVTGEQAFDAFKVLDHILQIIFCIFGTD